MTGQLLPVHLYVTPGRFVWTIIDPFVKNILQNTVTNPFLTKFSPALWAVAKASWATLTQPVSIITLVNFSYRYFKANRAGKLVRNIRHFKIFGWSFVFELYCYTLKAINFLAEKFSFLFWAFQMLSHTISKPERDVKTYLKQTDNCLVFFNALINHLKFMHDELQESFVIVNNMNIHGMHTDSRGN